MFLLLSLAVVFWVELLLSLYMAFHSYSLPSVRTEQNELKETISWKVSLFSHWAIRCYTHKDNCSTSLETSRFSLINIRLEELTQKHRPFLGQLVLEELQLQLVLWKCSHEGNRAAKRTWWKITIVYRCANRTLYHFEIFKEYLYLRHNLACFFNC